jgi:hypothetical protein
VASLTFGAGIQWLGARYASGARMSGVSAPWLLVPFLAGWTQPRRRDAALLGLGVTFAALGGYFALMWSPMEGVNLLHAQHGTLIGHHVKIWTTSYSGMRLVAEVLRLLASQSLWIVAGAMMGPLFGFLGSEWRAARTWRSGLAIALVFCLEPFAVLAFHATLSRVPFIGGFGTGFALDLIAVAEIASGVILLVAVAQSIRRRRKIGTQPS